MINFFYEDPVSFSEIIVIKCLPYLAMLKNAFKKLLHPHPETDDFKNLITSSLSTDTSSLVRIS